MNITISKRKLKKAIAILPLTTFSAKIGREKLGFSLFNPSGKTQYLKVKGD